MEIKEQVDYAELNLESLKNLVRRLDRKSFQHPLVFEIEDDILTVSMTRSKTTEEKRIGLGLTRAFIVGARKPHPLWAG